MKMLSLHFEQKHLPLNSMKRIMFAPKEDTITCPFIDGLTLRPCSKRFLVSNLDDIRHVAQHVFAHIPDMVDVKAHQFHELAANMYPVKSLEGCPLPYCNSNLCDGNPDFLHKNHSLELALFILSAIAGPESILISSALNLLVESRKICLQNILANQVPLQIQESDRISSEENTTNVEKSMNEELHVKDNPEESCKFRNNEEIQYNAQVEEQQVPSNNENITRPVPVPEEIEAKEDTQCNKERTEPFVQAFSVRLADIAYSRKWNKRVCRSWKRFMMEQTDEYLQVNFNFIPSRPCKVPNCDFRAHNCAALMKHIKNVHAK